MQFSNASPVIEQIFELIKDQISEAGFEMTLQPLDFQTVVDNANAGNFQAAGLNWSGSVDPDGFVTSLFHSGAGFNVSHYSSPELDALVDEARQVLDFDKRVALYSQIMNRLADDEPAVVYDWSTIQATSRKNMQNIQVGSSIYSLLYKVWKS